MHRFFGDQAAYVLFDTVASYATILCSLFFFKSKRNSMGFISKCAVYFASRLNQKVAKIVEVLFVLVESYLFALFLNYSVRVNRPLGDLLNTGANYFGLLMFAPILWSLLSVILVSNPLKQIDVVTILAPVQLIFLKLACFFNGCCWGIPWEHGLYNYHYDHPGKQVPVQAIEAFWGLAIFVFLLFYRKKAKKGTVYPMYMMLFSFTRFFSEFFRNEENVLGPLKTFHLLCIAGFVIGLVLFLIMRKYSEKLSDFFDSIPDMIKQKFESAKEQKALAYADAKAQEEVAEQERLEKVRLAREKAKARKQ